MNRPDGRPMDRNELILWERARKHDPKVQTVRFFLRDGATWVEIAHVSADILHRPVENGDETRFSAEWAVFQREGRP
jgi:hypothetical protein